MSAAGAASSSSALGLLYDEAEVGDPETYVDNTGFGLGIGASIERKGARKFAQASRVVRVDGKGAQQRKRDLVLEGGAGIEIGEDEEEEATAVSTTARGGAAGRGRGGGGGSSSAAAAAADAAAGAASAAAPIDVSLTPEEIENIVQNVAPIVFSTETVAGGETSAFTDTLSGVSSARKVLASSSYGNDKKKETGFSSKNDSKELLHDAIASNYLHIFLTSSDRDEVVEKINEVTMSHRMNMRYMAAAAAWFEKSSKEKRMNWRQLAEWIIGNPVDSLKLIAETTSSFVERIKKTSPSSSSIGSGHHGSDFGTLYAYIIWITQLESGQYDFLMAENATSAFSDSAFMDREEGGGGRGDGGGVDEDD